MQFGVGAGRALFIALCLMAAACSGRGSLAPALTQADASAATPASASREFRLGAGDQLRITVFGQPELTGQFLVSAHGTIAYPLVGEVEAVGRTIPDFTQHLAETLQAGYVRQPNISIEVTNYRPFFILGEVEEPGTYPFSAGLTVMRAVATAGGFTYRASSRRVFIMHDNETVEREYDLTSATPVQPGDTVRVSERWF